MSELIEKIEEAVGGIFGNNHELKPVAEPALVAALKAGEAILSPEHLAEIKSRRAVADLDTLIAACEKYIELLKNFGWSPESEAPAEPAQEA